MKHLRGHFVSENVFCFLFWYLKVLVRNCGNGKWIQNTSASCFLLKQVTKSKQCYIIVIKSDGRKWNWNTLSQTKRPRSSIPLHFHSVISSLPLLMPLDFLWFYLYQLFIDQKQKRICFMLIWVFLKCSTYILLIILMFLWSFIMLQCYFIMVDFTVIWSWLKMIILELIRTTSWKKEIPNLMLCLVKWLVELNQSLGGNLRWVR